MTRLDASRLGGGNKPRITCLGLAALLAFATFIAHAAEDPPPCDKNHYILDLPCRVKATDAAIGRAKAVTTDSAGNVYFSSPSIVFRIDAQGWLIRVAGNGTDGFSGDGGPATEALLNFPAIYPELALDPYDYWEFLGGIAVDAAGQVYIADAYNNRIRQVDSKGVIHTFADESRSVPWWPQGVAVDAVGSVYVTGQFGSLVKFPVEGPTQLLADWPSLMVPEGIALDPDGSVYVAEAICTVRKVRPDSTVVRAAGGCGRSGPSGGSLAWPYSVALDSEGNLLISDTWNNCIRKVDRAGAMTTIAGQCGYHIGGYSGDGGPAALARFLRPHGIAVDSSGNVFVADSANNRIRKIDADGIITTIAGNGDVAGR